MIVKIDNISHFLFKQFIECTLGTRHRAKNKLRPSYATCLLNSKHPIAPSHTPGFDRFDWSTPPKQKDDAKRCVLLFIGGFMLRLHLCVHCSARLAGVFVSVYASHGYTNTHKRIHAFLFWIGSIGSSCCLFVSASSSVLCFRFSFRTHAILCCFA